MSCQYEKKSIRFIRITRKLLLKKKRNRKKEIDKSKSIVNQAFRYLKLNRFRESLRKERGFRLIGLTEWHDETWWYCATCENYNSRRDKSASNISPASREMHTPGRHRYLLC